MIYSQEYIQMLVTLVFDVSLLYYIFSFALYWYYYCCKIYSCLLVIRWRSSVKSRSQQEITEIYLSTSQTMFAVLISVICSSMTEVWPGCNWSFWSNPSLIVPNAPIITGAIFVPTLHILLISVSWVLYWFSFSYSFVLSISREVFYYYYYYYYYCCHYLLRCRVKPINAQVNRCK